MSTIALYYIYLLLMIVIYIKGDDAEVEEEKEIDAYDLAEPVDVLSKMPKEFYTGLVIIYVILSVIFSEFLITNILLGFFKIERKKRSVGKFVRDLQDTKDCG